MKIFFYNLFVTHFELIQNSSKEYFHIIMVIKFTRRILMHLLNRPQNKIH